MFLWMTQMQMHVLTHTLCLIYAHTCAHTHTCMHAHIHTHMHAHTHTHTFFHQSSTKWQWPLLTSDWTHQTRSIMICRVVASNSINLGNSRHTHSGWLWPSIQDSPAPGHYRGSWRRRKFPLGTGRSVGSKIDYQEGRELSVCLVDKWK